MIGPSVILRAQVNSVQLTNFSAAKNNIIPNLLKAIVDGSARKPALRQDTGYMVEKT